MSFIRQNKKIAFLSLGIFVLFIFASIFVVNQTEKVSGATGGGGGAGGDGIGGGAGAVCPLSGWAWSGYTGNSGTGWMSFNSSTGGGASHRVEMQSNGNLTGYAWSSPGKDGGGNDSIGWINFDPVGPFPAGPNYSAQVNLTSGSSDFGKITGWARACAVFASGCSGTLKPSLERGGWDGWISMNGSNYGIQWNSNTQRFEGYAWGSSQVIGWLSFAGSNYAVTITDSACQAILNNSGGGGFDYGVDIPILTLFVPEFSNNLKHPVFISSVGQPQQVRMVSISDDPLSNFVKVKIGDDNNNCVPDSGCELKLEIDYDLRNYQNSEQDLNYSVTFESDGLSDKIEPFIIRIKIIDPGEASCSPDPQWAVVGQEITWTADPGDLNNPVLYRWFGENLNGRTGKEVSTPYSTVGVKTANVDIYYGESCQLVDGDPVGCENTNKVCSPNLQVFSEFEFEHL